MSRTAYVDESMRGKNFLLAVVIVPASSAGELEQTVRALRMSLQQRLHLKKETDSRRRQIVDAIARCTFLKSRFYQAPEPVVSARDLCLRTAVVDLVDDAVHRLVLDRVDDHQITRDRVSIHDSIRKLDSPFAFEHAESRKFAGLQASDVIAWAYGAGGLWRNRIEPLIEKTTSL